MKHRIGRTVFATLVGLATVWFSWQWITDGSARELRLREEAVVRSARDALHEVSDLRSLEIVDPLAPRRSVGKVYVFENGNSWEVSGYYRRADNDSWHAYLLRLDDAGTLIFARVADGGLAARAAVDSRLEIVE